MKAARSSIGSLESRIAPASVFNHMDVDGDKVNITFTAPPKDGNGDDIQDADGHQSIGGLWSLHRRTGGPGAVALGRTTASS
jgi:hypothetical protein